MVWHVEISEAAAKTLSKLDRPVAQRVIRFIRERIATLEDPRSVGSALKGGEFGDYWKYRVGDFRVICDIQDQKLRILVLKIGHRRDVYR